MKERHKFPKPVAFNTHNAIDRAMLEFVKKRNFSGYVKKLIIADMKTKGIEIPNGKQATKTHDNETRLERLRRELADKRVNNDSGSNSDT
ncbi:hypothetical protein [Lysinibacillus sp. TE18511]